MEARWLPDPSSRHQVRYWDGQAWTPWVADGQQPFLDTDPRPLPTLPSRPPEPGWYPDARGVRRYFDGAGWTENTRAGWPYTMSKVVAAASLVIAALATFAMFKACGDSGFPATSVSRKQQERANLLFAVAGITFLVACGTAIAAAIWRWVLSRAPRAVTAQQRAAAESDDGKSGSAFMGI